MTETEISAQQLFVPVRADGTKLFLQISIYVQCLDNYSANKIEFEEEDVEEHQSFLAQQHNEAQSEASSDNEESNQVLRS